MATKAIRISSARDRLPRTFTGPWCRGGRSMSRRWLGGRVGGRSTRLLVAVILAGTVIAGLLAGGASAAPKAPRAHGTRWWAPHQALVRFRDGASLASMNAAHAAVGATPLQ